MGAGYHGGFGATSGSRKISSTQNKSHNKTNYTKQQLLDFIDRKTPHSSIIVDRIKKGNIKISVLGNDLFERYFGVDSDVIGLAKENKIYVRKDSSSIHSDIVHEGTHALDFLSGIPYNKISSWDGEIRAYTAEHHFQKSAGLEIQFANEDEIKVHVWRNYKKEGER